MILDLKYIFLFKTSPDKKQFCHWHTLAFVQCHFYKVDQKQAKILCSNTLLQTYFTWHRVSAIILLMIYKWIFSYPFPVPWISQSPRSAGLPHICSASLFSSGFSCSARISSCWLSRYSFLKYSFIIPGIEKIISRMHSFKPDQKSPFFYTINHKE